MTVGRDPWLVPVPTEPSRFVALDASHAPWNLQAALSRITPFAWDVSALDDDHVVYADLQLHPADNAPARLGSGRAGIRHGYVVKGLGRTTLAGNWNDPSDRFHGNGWLSASSALRERLVSEALRRDGAGHCLVATEGLLLRALDAPERELLARTAASQSWHLSPLDRSAVALALRPGGYARLSNVLWALHHHQTAASFVGDLMLRLLRYLSPAGAPSTLDGTPDEVAAALAAAAARSVDLALEWVRHGVWWLSFHDNFALDGRFLDLETPVYRGAPWVGFARSRGSARLHVVGFEALLVARQWRLFARMLAARARWMADARVSGERRTRSYLRALATSLRGALRTSRVFDPDALTGRVVRSLSEVLGATRRERAVLGVLGARMSAGVFADRPVRFDDLAGAVMTGEQPAQPTVTGRAEYLFVKGLGAAPMTPAARWFRDALESLESLEDRDDALDATRGWIATAPGGAASPTHARGAGRETR